MSTEVTSAAAEFARRQQSPVQRVQHQLHARPWLSPLLLLLIAFIAFFIATPTFLTANSMGILLQQTAVVAALAVGLSSTVAVGAASALPLGSQAGGGDSGRGGHGGPGGPGGGHDGEGFRNGSGRFGGAVGGSTGSGSTSGSGSTTGQGGQGGTSWCAPPQGAPNLNGEVPTKPGGNPMTAS